MLDTIFIFANMWHQITERICSIEVKSRTLELDFLGPNPSSSNFNWVSPFTHDGVFECVCTVFVWLLRV